jgi:hypothetical protein
MAVREAREPASPLWRVGRGPDPLAFPPRPFAGKGRYDHPDAAFLTLYAAEQRRGAFVETLDAFRPAVADLAVARALPEGDSGVEEPAFGAIPDSYFRKLLARLALGKGQRWLDLRSPETHQVLRSELAPTLVLLGYTGRFVWGDLLGHDHRVTQAVAVWAHDRGYDGVTYSSCHDARLDCWAIFDRARFRAVGEPSAIRTDDADLVAVAHLFDLTVP